ncbi:hypothetical protein G7Y31_06910 [Corynebacterium lizhenjunii]|uniref:Uncharacterized protein n=1 Tax=Corynebacterium lizhenjunii TaxID=2709394 RepID=A0A7T0KD68_9CORY|nr:hypothetical protein [Corynebacterium lizhenjunii]QPK78314.1 hypothetical protein G7Y31_06910 [Corynebacterium lizhenjunii]
MNHQDTGDTRSLNLVLNGTLQSMDAQTVLKGLELLTSLVAGFTDKPVKMGALEEGSSITGVIVSPKVEAEILAGIAQLRDGEAIPENWTLKQVQNVRDLTRLESKAGVTGVKLHPSYGSESVSLDAPLRDAIDGIVKKIPLSLGSVTGELYHYSANNGRFRARLHPSSGGPKVNISFTEELDEELRNGLRQKVSIYGILKRHPETHVIEEIDARRIEIREPSGPARPGRGIWKDLKDQGVTVDGLMGAIRGEDRGGREHG